MIISIIYNIKVASMSVEELEEEVVCEKLQ